MRLAEFLLSEESNTELARHYTTALNSRFAQYDIPVKITTHFIDRMPDPRNLEPITAGDVADFFSKLLIKRKKYLQQMADGSSVQIIDLESGVTVPFIKSQGVLVATTIMRGDMRQGNQRKIAI